MAQRIDYVVSISRNDRFPIDMLRRQQAWPASVVDSDLISILTRGDPRELVPLPARVTVRLTSEERPDAAAWARFCADVRELEG